MKSKRKAIHWILTVSRLLVIVALPLWGFQSLVSGQGPVEPVEETPLTKLANQLAKETVKVNRKAGAELAAHVLATHSQISEHELLARSEGLRAIAPVAIVAHFTNQSLEQVLEATNTGASLDEVITRSGVDLKSAQNKMLSALIGMRVNHRNASKAMLDIDADGLSNAIDPDVDGDGTLNAIDTDVDGDGAPNSIDTDVDSDSLDNGNDDDVDGDIISNYDDKDIDGDGIANLDDDDRDGDGILNIQDGDANANGVSDDEETEKAISSHSGSGSGGSGSGGSGSGGGGSGSSSTEFTARVESLPNSGLMGDWRIGGRTVHVTNATEIRGNINVGVTVEVRGNSRADGSVDATRIRVEDGNGNGNGNANGNANGNGNTNGNGNGNGNTNGNGNANGNTNGNANGNGNSNGNANGNGNGNGNANGNGNTNGNGNANGNGNQTGTFLKFKGFVQSMPQNWIGTWMINGQAVVVSQTSQINQENGAIGTGIKVVVKGTLLSNGVIIASKVIVR